MAQIINILERGFHFRKDDDILYRGKKNSFVYLFSLLGYNYSSGMCYGDKTAKIYDLASGLQNTQRCPALNNKYFL